MTIPYTIHGHEPFQRTPPTPIEKLPGDLPVAQVGDKTDAASVAAHFIPRLATLNTEDITQDAIWRDCLALTGTFRTFYSAKRLLQAWKATFSTHSPAEVSMTPETAEIVRVGPDHAWVNAAFKFRNTAVKPPQLCSGYVSLVPGTDGSWKLWMLRTILENVEGWGDVDVLSPSLSTPVDHFGNGSSNGALDERASQKDRIPQHFDCIVVGGGQAGLGVGGRLQALQISYVIIDRHAAVGDSWKLRYDATKLHTAREYGHLPFYQTYGPEYPEFLTKDHVAAGHQDYVQKYGINIWTSTTLVSSSWSAKTQRWTCSLKQGEEGICLTACHLIFAPGSGSEKPNMPTYPNKQAFQGTVLHSSQYKNSKEWTGKRGVILGSANTAHDVADDMLENGLSSVTMVQRGRTWVLPVEHYMVMATKSYNEDIPTVVADRSDLSWPVSVHRQIAMYFFHAMARKDHERFDALEEAGFNVERYGDIDHIFYERQGGHYMDVGTSAKIADGLIKIKSGVAPTHYTADGLAFSDGTELKANLIVFATGFMGNVRTIAGAIVGPEIEAQLEDYWGLDSEGEIRGAFKYTGHPGVWYAGGAIGMARYYSRFIALQIKGQLMGLPLQVYND